MIIKSVQKIIKVGSSMAVTLPARDAKAAGLQVGDEVEVEARAIKPAALKIDQALVDDYDAFTKQYAQTLKNLSQR